MNLLLINVKFFPDISKQNFIVHYYSHFVQLNIIVDDILWQMAPPVPITSDEPIVFACGPNCPALPPVLRGSFGFPQGCTVGTNCQMEASWGCRKNTDKIYLSVAGVYQSKDNDQTDEFYVAFGLNQLAQMVRSL